MSDPNETRRLAPDTKWILQIGGTIIGTALAAILAVTQYQLNTLRAEQLRAVDRIEASLSQVRDDMHAALAARDTLLSSLTENLTSLREGRAKHRQQLSNIGESMDRVISVSMQTQARAAETEGRLRELLKQIETNGNLLTRIVDQQAATAQTLSERLTRLEARGGVGQP